VNENSLLELAERSARLAGELLARRFREPATGVSAKSTPTDPVSDADRESETLLVETIAAERPDDGFVTEESPDVKSRSGVRWVVDPLDATVNYLFRIPWWCVSVAVEDEAGTIAGAIYNPNVDEMFTALRGKGAFLNGTPMAVSTTDRLDRALIGTGFAYLDRARADQAAVVARVLPRARDVRRMGSAALDLASLACGRLDGFYEAPLERWDRAAGLLMLAEAGGVTTPLAGPQGLTDGVIGSGPALHDQLCAVVLQESATTGEAT
jgi:myo-inositol-1(or 4)-monophosphatase